MCMHDSIIAQAIGQGLYVDRNCSVWHCLFCRCTGAQASLHADRNAGEDALTLFFEIRDDDERDLDGKARGGAMVWRQR